MNVVFPFLFAASVINAKDISVMVFGDSYGDTGPTYHQVQKMFDERNIKATVRSSAVGGTAACFWAAGDNGTAIVRHANKSFPELQDGPDFLWYTAGADDIWQSVDFQACEIKAKTWGDLLKCMRTEEARISDCSTKMLKIYTATYPKSKIMHSGYDVPCQNKVCRATFSGLFDLHYCGEHEASNRAGCNNHALYDFLNIYFDSMHKKFPVPHYTTLFMMGTVQKAAGIPGADVGKPVINQTTKCSWETLCVHPKYNSPAGNAWGEAFWNLYFSKHMHHHPDLETASIVV